MTVNLLVKKTARIAGLLYLIVVPTWFFSLAYIPKTLFIWDNSTVTFKNIVSSELLFRMEILSSVICYIAFSFLPIVLNLLLKSVSAFHAKIMAVLALISVPVSFMNLQNKLSILSQAQEPIAIGSVLCLPCYYCFELNTISVKKV